MKKCPFCAEEIQDEAVICRFCGNKVVTFPTPEKQVREPSVILSVLMMVGLLVAIYGVTYFIAANWEGSIADLESFTFLYRLGVSLLVTFLAVPGLNPTKKEFLRYVGIFVLSFIPIVSWLVTYWAGKGLARILFG